jgi:hypothetical protein
VSCADDEMRRQDVHASFFPLLASKSGEKGHIIWPERALQTEGLEVIDANGLL